MGRGQCSWEGKKLRTWGFRKRRKCEDVDRSAASARMTGDLPVHIKSPIREGETKLDTDRLYNDSWSGTKQ
jgi:hypothetical protein